jgi:uncharacterized protein DUF6193
VAAQFRTFLFDCWDRDACLAKGTTWSLTRVAQTVDRWVASDCTAAALASEFPFVEPTPQATAYEAGAELEDRWQTLIAEAEQRRTLDHSEWDRWDEFVRAASERPQLRQLFPVPGCFSFTFSRCTRYPFTCDTPSVTGGGDDGYSVWDVTADARILGRGDAEFAADLVVSHLPPDCGPALVGTVDDLARQLAVRDGISVEEVLRRIWYVRRDR